MTDTALCGAGPDARPGPARPARRTLPPNAAYWLAAAVIGLCLFASVVPTPLYDLYAARWHFSALTLTLIYATYAFGVLAALLGAGRVSDQVGRRPVLLLALGILMLSSALFVVADSGTWLFVARGVQGVATGLALSAASAALLDLHPRRDALAVGLANAVASSLGLGLGILVSAALVHGGVAVRTLPYVVLLVLFAAAVTGAYLMPEPVGERSALRLTLQRPSVPAGIRHPFALAGLAVLSSWSVGGLFFSLGPELSAELFHTTDALTQGVGAVALGLCAALAQVSTRRSPGWLGASAGSAALAGGIVLIVVAAATGSSAAFVLGCIVAGLGFGAAFLGGLRQLVVVIPAEHRATVMSAFYLVAYTSLSVPAVLAGLVVPHLGLETTFAVFGSIVAAIALVVAAEAWRTRPGRPGWGAAAVAGATASRPTR